MLRLRTESSAASNSRRPAHAAKPRRLARGLAAAGAAVGVAGALAAVLGTAPAANAATISADPALTTASMAGGSQAMMVSASAHASMVAAADSNAARSAPATAWLTASATGPGQHAAAAKPAAAPKAPAKPAAAATASDPRSTAKAMLRQYGWSASQFSYLNQLWFHESNWSVTATNSGSGAYGIPQALPGSQMASAGPDWKTNPATQIKWGLTYIHDRYGSPAGAWAHEESDGWY